MTTVIRAAVPEQRKVLELTAPNADTAALALTAMAAGRPHWSLSASNADPRGADVAQRFCDQLETAAIDYSKDAELFDLPAPVAATIARYSTQLAHEIARNDPMLGDGRDVRAVYALTLGLTLAAGMMLDVIDRAEG